MSKASSTNGGRDDSISASVGEGESLSSAPKAVLGALMNDSPTIIELRRRPGKIIYAIPYRDGRRLKPLSLPDGAIVEIPTPDERYHAPAQLDECLGLAPGGGLATVGHANLGLVASYLSLEGVFFLPSGEVAAVYGAEAVPIGEKSPLC